MVTTASLNSGKKDEDGIAELSDLTESAEIDNSAIASWLESVVNTMQESVS